MFEAYPYEYLLDNVLSQAPQGIDTRPGSIYFDAISGILLKIAKFYTDLDLVFELVSLDTALGSYLDDKAKEHAVVRNLATPAMYQFIYEGSQPRIGSRFFADGLYFSLISTVDGALALQAEQAGANYNNVHTRTPAVPVNTIQGLALALFGEILKYGTDDELDEDLRRRVREKIAGPAENGNKQHYKTWCESDEDVGRARIIPLWRGPNTVKGILFNKLGLPADDIVVARVQEYVDPDEDGDGEGDGLGEGVANLGAHFTAVAAGTVMINVDYTAILTNGATVAQAAQETRDALTKYFKDLMLTASETEETVVRYSSIGAMISNLGAILDYANLTLNNATANIQPGLSGCAVLGEVKVNVQS